MIRRSIKMISVIYVIVTVIIAVPGSAFAFTSACGGSVDHPCDCTDRYVCDNDGSACACQGDQNCADTACGSNRDRTSKKK
jgi:hypothetical protein